VNAAEKLTENVRVRMTPSERAELEQVAISERRSASAVARRAIERELERVRAGSSGRS
jgi:predicted transcriptional regulator